AVVAMPGRVARAVRLAVSLLVTADELKDTYAAQDKPTEGFSSSRHRRRDRSRGRLPGRPGLESRVSRHRHQQLDRWQIRPGFADGHRQRRCGKTGGPGASHARGDPEQSVYRLCGYRADRDLAAGFDPLSVDPLSSSGL